MQRDMDAARLEAGFAAGGIITGQQRRSEGGVGEEAGAALAPDAQLEAGAGYGQISAPGQTELTVDPAAETEFRLCPGQAEAEAEQQGKQVTESHVSASGNVR